MILALTLWFFAIKANVQKITNTFLSYADTASGRRNMTAHPLQAITGETKYATVLLIFHELAISCALSFSFYYTVAKPSLVSCFAGTSREFRKHTSSTAEYSSYWNIKLEYFNILLTWGWWTAVAQWLRCCATNRKVAGSIPDGVIGIFYWRNPSDHTMTLGLTQPLTGMSTRRISWG